jgi:hypothetical protein
MNEELMAAVRRLTMEEKYLLMQSLSEMIEIDKAEDEQARHRRSEELCKAMEQMTGVSVSSRTKRVDEVNARVVLSYFLTVNGESQPYIARLVNHDHSTISQYLTRMRYTIGHPMADPNLIRTYNEFKKRIDNDIQ